MPLNRLRQQGQTREVVNRVRVAAEPEVVFDYVTDLARELEWNPQLLAVVRLTSGSSGVGERYRLRLRGTGWVTTEFVSHQRPVSWVSHGTSRRLTAEERGRVTRVGSGSELVIRTRLEPHGILAPAAPLVRRVVRRHWGDNLERIRSRLEDSADPGAAPPSSSGSPAPPREGLRVRGRHPGRRPRAPFARLRERVTVCQCPTCAACGRRRRPPP